MIRSRQKGIALIYVLLIFALITLMASQMVTSLWLHTEKNARYLERMQARHYALGAEQYITLLLEQDFETDKKNKRMVDHGKEAWNISTVDYDIEQGDIEIILVDEQSRFNINWLSDSGGQGPASGINGQPPGGRLQAQGHQVDNVDYLQMLQNLLSTQAIDPQLAYKIKDWVDSDQEAAETGAEDMVYLALEHPRRTADTELISVSELRLIDGFTADDLEHLIPLVTVLPGRSKINLNTALPEVIRSVSLTITEGDARAIIDARGDKGIEKLADLNSLPSLSGRIGPLQSVPVEFSSSYFSAYIKATYRDTTFYLKTSLVRHPDGQVKVVGREIGPGSYWVVTKKES